MARISPIRAVMPSKDKVSLINARSYEDYHPGELAAQLEYNPYSFLHILHPAYVNVQKDSLGKRYGHVRAKYLDFKDEGILVPEPNPVYFVYELISEHENFTGIIAGVSLTDYLEGHTKKHEDTLQYRVEQFEQHLETAGFNTEPVLLAYLQNPELDAWIHSKKATMPDFHFTSSKRETHTLWRIEDLQEQQQLETLFAKIPDLYIADGHHRMASGALLQQRQQINSADHFMAFLIPENKVRIYEYNRVVRDLNGHSTQSFLELLNADFDWFELDSKRIKPGKSGEFGMYLDQSAYKLIPKKHFDNPDALFLYETVLNPILGIEDLRTDARIEYLPGNIPESRLIALVDSEEFEIAFCLFPMQFEDIIKTADQNGILPPKSTYILPKFSSGLVIHELF